MRQYLCLRHFLVLLLHAAQNSNAATASSTTPKHNQWSLRGYNQGKENNSPSLFLSLSRGLRKLEDPNDTNDQLTISSPVNETLDEESLLDELQNEEPRPGDVQQYEGKDSIVGEALSSTQAAAETEASEEIVTEPKNNEENENNADPKNTKVSGDDAENPNAENGDNGDNNNNNNNNSNNNNDNGQTGGGESKDQVNDDTLWNDDEHKNGSSKNENDDLWTDDFAPKDGEEDPTQNSSEDIVTTEELKEEERKVRFLSTSGALFAILAMIFTAYQMSENPDGIYAAMCRLCITIFGLIFRIILSPCKGLFGHSSRSSSYGHVPVSTMDYGYRDPSVEMQ